MANGSKLVKKYINKVISEEVILPSIATELLATRPTPDDPDYEEFRQRAVREHHVDWFVREGLRDLVGAVLIDWYGRLIDGQHKLITVERTGKPWRVVVIRGCDPSDGYVVNSGLVDSAGDWAAKLGVNYPSERATFIGWVHRLKSGAVVTNTGYHLTFHELKVALNDIRYIDAYDTARRLFGRTTDRMLPVALGAAFWFVLREIHVASASSFMERIATGVGLSVNDSVSALRRRLIVNKSSRAKLSSRHIAALVIKAWNADRSGGTIKHLKFISGEPFPVMRGGANGAPAAARPQVTDGART